MTRARRQRRSASTNSDPEGVAEVVRLGGPHQGVLERDAGCAWKLHSQEGCIHERSKHDRTGKRRAVCASNSSASSPDRSSVWAYLTDSDAPAGMVGEGRSSRERAAPSTLMDGHIRGVVTGWRPPQFLCLHLERLRTGRLGPRASGRPQKSRFPVLSVVRARSARRRRSAAAHRIFRSSTAFENQNMMGWHTFLDMLDNDPARREGGGASVLHEEERGPVWRRHEQALAR